ncbi:MAG: hypothetical protein BWY84_00015 [Candidatus Aerophobetes bacterium ADurb.Bin490]|nr:MAG: hypothetical protein BWY84_00015 [Candidatus Aerophobetes bacterium ADurb.Bin490]
MEFNLANFKPETAVLKLNGKEYAVKKYSLKYRAEFLKKYGFERLQKITFGIDEEVSADMLKAEVVYTLLADKQDFKSYNDFIDFICSSDDYLEINRVYLIVTGVASGMTPDEEEAERENAEKKNKPE